MKLWIGQSVSELGSRITREGLPYTAVLVLKASPAQMGILSALGGASVLAFGLVAGFWVDRLPRRPILIATDLGRALLLFTVPTAALLGMIGMVQIYAVAALAGVLTVFFDVAYQTYLPALVDKEQIVEGNSKLMLTATTAEVLGPGVTGLLVQLITAPIAILFDALSFVFSAVMVLFIKKRDAAPVRVESEQHPIRESISGLQFIWHHAILKPLMLRSMIAYFAWGFLGTLYVIYAIDTLHLSPVMLGVTIAVGGVGGMIGSTLAARVVARIGLGFTFIATAFIHACAITLMPLAHGPAWMAMLYLMGAQLFGDSAGTIYFINEVSLRQAIVPDTVLGRVNAGMQLAGRGVMPLGSLVCGFIANAWGSRTALWISVAITFLSIALLFTKALRDLKDHDSRLSG